MKRRYGAAPAIPAGETATVILIRPGGGEAGVVKGLYINWELDMVNYIIVDGALYGDPCQYDIGKPSQTEPQDIFFRTTFEVRSENTHGSETRDGECVVLYQPVHDNKSGPAKGFRARGPPRFLRGRFIR